MKLEGNAVLITGGTSGIGYELASQLVQRRNAVLITGRNEDALRAAAKNLPGVKTFRCDVCSQAEIDALHDYAAQHFPRLDVLINNAGVMNKLNVHHASADEASAEIETNLTGTVRMVLRFLPLLKSRERAAIVNVSSGLAFNPYPIAPVYGATKAAIHSFTQSLRIQLRNTNVRVFELAPPAIDTPLSHKFAEDLKGTPPMSATTLVREALRGLEKDRPEIRVGFANVSKLMSRLAPGLILKILSKPVDRMLSERQLT